MDYSTFVWKFVPSLANRGQATSITWTLALHLSIVFLSKTFLEERDFVKKYLEPLESLGKSPLNGSEHSEHRLRLTPLWPAGAGLIIPCIGVQMYPIDTGRDKALQK